MNQYPSYMLSGSAIRWIYRIMMKALFAVIIFFLTRQFPFGSFSYLMNISLIAVFGLSAYDTYIHIKESHLNIKAFVFCLQLLILLYAIAGFVIFQHPVGLVLRFSTILILLTLAYFIKLPTSIVRIFNVFVLIEAIFVIALEAILLFAFTKETYAPVRFFFLDRGFGDVYTYNGWFYYIQIRGTAILPFAYMFTYIRPGNRSVWLTRGILFFSVIFAGNFGYLIGLAFFHLIWFFKSDDVAVFRSKVFKVLILAALLILPVMQFVFSTLERKQGQSLGTRFDQTEVLMSDLGSSLPNFFLGRGLGNQIERQTDFRDYSHFIYYELQSLYFLNQMGVILFLIFITYNILMTLYNYRQNPWIIVLYASYIIYAATNPYFLDTTQIVVILMLNTLIDFKLRGI